MNALPTLTPHMIFLYTYILHRCESIKKLLEWQADTRVILSSYKETKDQLTRFASKVYPSRAQICYWTIKEQCRTQATLGRYWTPLVWCLWTKKEQNINRTRFSSEKESPQVTLTCAKPPCDGGVNPRDLKMVQCEWERKNSLIWSLRGRGATEEEERRADLRSSNSART